MKAASLSKEAFLIYIIALTLPISFDIIVLKIISRNPENCEGSVSLLFVHVGQRQFAMVLLQNNFILILKSNNEVWSPEGLNLVVFI